MGMPPSSTISGGKYRGADRRSSPRELVQWAILSYFDENNWGQILDLSEKGMLLVCGHLPAVHRRITFLFESGSAPSQFRKTLKPIMGEVQWTREFERLAGVQFVDLGEEDRQQIQQWLSPETPGSFAVEEERRIQEDGVYLWDGGAALPSDSKQSSRENGEASEEKLKVFELASSTPTEFELTNSENIPEVANSANDESLLEPVPDSPSELEAYKNDPVPSSQMKYFALFGISVLLVLLAVVFGARILASLRVRQAFDQVQRAEASIALSRTMPAAVAARPFLVEVVDVSNHRWTLPFPEGGFKAKRDDPASKSNRTASRREPVSANAIASATSSATPSEDARKFVLPAPKVNETRNDIAAHGVPPAPVFDSKVSAPESASVSILSSPVAPVPAEKPPAVGGEVQQPRLIRSVSAEYPALARSRRIIGDVVLDALIDSAGRVKDVRVVSGPLELQSAAQAALRRWKYQPARLDGQPVAMHLSVTMRFHIP